MATSQNGWPVIESGSSRDLVNLSWVTGKVRAGDVYTIFDRFGRRFNDEVEPIRKAESWGYAPRSIRGSTQTSNHASGTAVDFNAPSHPLGASGTFTAQQVAALRRILADYDVLRWGGDYSGRKDEMHFEINKGARAVALLAEKLRATPAVTPREEIVALSDVDLTRIREAVTMRIEPVITVALNPSPLAGAIYVADHRTLTLNRIGDVDDYALFQAMLREVGLPIRHFEGQDARAFSGWRRIEYADQAPGGVNADALAAVLVPRVAAAVVDELIRRLA